MKKCKKCGKEITEDRDVCEECIQKVLLHGAKIKN